MTRQIVITIGFIFLFASVSTAQVSLRAKLRQLELGKTNLDEIKKLFGEPDTVKKETSSYAKGEPTSIKGKLIKGHVDYHDINSPSGRKMNLKDVQIRKLSSYSYSKLGLEFWLLDNPSELNSIVITNPGLWFHGIRIGNSLVTVTKLLGKNDNWWSTEGSNDWTLEYNKLGLYFYFPRDPKVPHFPMKLKQKPRVTSIEIFDRRVHFLG